MSRGLPTRFLLLSCLVLERTMSGTQLNRATAAIFVGFVVVQSGHLAAAMEV